MIDDQDFEGPSSLPGEPTDALPGSEQKIRVMTERAARREQLFHPQDGQWRPGHYTWSPPDPRAWPPQTIPHLHRGEDHDPGDALFGDDPDAADEVHVTGKPSESFA